MYRKGKNFIKNQLRFSANFSSDTLIHSFCFPEKQVEVHCTRTVMSRSQEVNSIFNKLYGSSDRV